MAKIISFRKKSPYESNVDSLTPSEKKRINELATYAADLITDPCENMKTKPLSEKLYDLGLKSPMSQGEILDFIYESGIWKK